MTTAAKAWTYSLIGAGVYVAMIVTTTIILHNNDISRPFLRALLWPISLTRFLFGGL